MNTITLKAYAKINWGLNVIGKTTNGYHSLDTIMENIDLYDTITITTEKKDIIVTCDNEKLCGDNNICKKAARMFFETANINDCAHIHIKKTIPMEAGLGGGSSDAGAVLNGLNILYENPLSKNDLKTIAVSLGADVGFFIDGGCHRAFGIGEILEKIDNKNKYTLLIAKGSKGVSTVCAYTEFDKIANPVLGDMQALAQGLIKKDYPIIKANMKNSLQEVSINHYEEIKNLIQTITNAGSIATMMTGSGSAVFGVFYDFAQAQKAQKALPQDIFSKVVATIDKSFEII